MVSDESAIVMPVGLTLYKSTAKFSQIRIQGLFVLSESQRMKVRVFVERLSLGFAIGNVQIAQTKYVSFIFSHRSSSHLFVKPYLLLFKSLLKLFALEAEFRRIF